MKNRFNLSLKGGILFLCPWLNRILIEVQKNLLRFGKFYSLSPSIQGEFPRNSSVSVSTWILTSSRIKTILILFLLLGTSITKGSDTLQTPIATKEKWPVFSIGISPEFFIFQRNLFSRIKFRLKARYFDIPIMTRVDFNPKNSISMDFQLRAFPKGESIAHNEVLAFRLAYSYTFLFKDRLGIFVSKSYSMFNYGRIGNNFWWFNLFNRSSQNRYNTLSSNLGFVWKQSSQKKYHWMIYYSPFWSIYQYYWNSNMGDGRFAYPDDFRDIFYAGGVQISFLFKL